MRVVLFYMHIDYIPEGSKFLMILPAPMQREETKEEKDQRIINNEDKTPKISGVLVQMLYEVTEMGYQTLVQNGFFGKDLNKRSQEWANQLGLPLIPLKDGKQHEFTFHEEPIEEINRFKSWVNDILYLDFDKLFIVTDSDSLFMLLPNNQYYKIIKGAKAIHKDNVMNIIDPQEKKEEALLDTYHIFYESFNIKDFEAWLLLWDEKFYDSFEVSGNYICIKDAGNEIVIIPDKAIIKRISKGVFAI